MFRPRECAYSANTPDDAADLSHNVFFQNDITVRHDCLHLPIELASYVQYPSPTTGGVAEAMTWPGLGFFPVYYIPAFPVIFDLNAKISKENKKIENKIKYTEVAAQSDTA